MTFRVAVASSDGKFINQHYGHAEQFLIFDIDDEGKYNFVEIRKNEPSCTGGDHTTGALENTIDIIKDVKVVLVAQIGPGASQSLLLNGIQPFMVPTFIDEALEKLASKYVKLKNEKKSETNESEETSE